MFQPDRSGPNALSRYWRALIAGAPAAELEQHGAILDPAMRALTDDMWATRTDQPPDPAFVARLERHLMQSQKENPMTFSSIRTTLQPAWSAPPISLPAPARGRFDRVGKIAITAIVSLALFVGAVIAFGRLDPGTSPASISAPTAASPAAATPAPGTTTLLDVDLPAAVLPAGALPDDAGRLSGLSYVYVDAGSSGTWPGNSCCPGQFIEHVVAGSLTFSSAGPFQVLHADQTLDNLAADAEVVLGPGDTMIARNETTFTAANTGSTPVEMVEWGYLSDPYQSFAGHRLQGWGGPGGLSVTNSVPSFPKGIHITLRRLVLQPGDGAPVYRPDGLRQVVVPNIETDILLTFGEGDFIAVDSHGDLTTAYTLEIAPLNPNNASTRPVVGMPPA